MTPSAVNAPPFRFRFRNPTRTSLNLRIEPLGDRVVIPGQATVEIHATEQLGHRSELEMTEDGIAIHGWVQNVFAVNSDGELHPLWTLPE